MKAFLEEYGLVIVIVIVVAALIALASYLSSTGKDKMKNTFNTMTGIGDSALNQAEDAANGIGSQP